MFLFLNAHVLLSYARCTEMSWASDWPSLAGNYLYTWVKGRKGLNYIGTRCGIMIIYTRSVWINKYSHHSKSQMRLERLQYEISVLH